MPAAVVAARRPSSKQSNLVLVHVQHCAGAINKKGTSVLVAGVARYKTTTTTTDYRPTTYRLRADYFAQVGKLLASVSCSASRDAKKQPSEAHGLPGHQRSARNLFGTRRGSGSELVTSGVTKKLVGPACCPERRARGRSARRRARRSRSTIKPPKRRRRSEIGRPTKRDHAQDHELRAQPRREHLG